MANVSKSTPHRPALLLDLLQKQQKEHYKHIALCATSALLLVGFAYLGHKIVGISWIQANPLSALSLAIGSGCAAFAAAYFGYLAATDKDYISDAKLNKYKLAAKAEEDVSKTLAKHRDQFHLIVELGILTREQITKYLESTAVVSCDRNEFLRKYKKDIEHSKVYDENFESIDLWKNFKIKPSVEDVIKEQKAFRNRFWIVVAVSTLVLAAFSLKVGLSGSLWFSEHWVKASLLSLATLTAIGSLIYALRNQHRVKVFNETNKPEYSADIEEKQSMHYVLTEYSDDIDLLLTYGVITVGQVLAFLNKDLQNDNIPLSVIFKMLRTLDKSNNQQLSKNNILATWLSSESNKNLIALKFWKEASHLSIPEILERYEATEYNSYIGSALEGDKKAMDRYVDEFNCTAGRSNDWGLVFTEAYASSGSSSSSSTDWFLIGYMCGSMNGAGGSDLGEALLIIYAIWLFLFLLCLVIDLFLMAGSAAGKKMEEHEVNKNMHTFAEGRAAAIRV